LIGNILTSGILFAISYQDIIEGEVMKEIDTLRSSDSVMPVVEHSSSRSAQTVLLSGKSKN
jgi:predicted thioredoxin/glutaredoxin